MSETTRPTVAQPPHVMMSKVPQITLWFWVIKILCTTVGESFADWINVTLGVGLVPTAIIFTVALAAALGWQLTLAAYRPVVYWLVVVVLSVTGTLYTDILTDNLGVPLAVSSGAFAAVLAAVFGAWFVKERTLSIHSIVTLPRETFYWLAILVTFAFGTAVGDWTLEITGWGPGTSVLLPAGLIVVIVVGWKLGANAVLSFWLAYVLTRPLGANLGDWLGLPTDQQGLGLGVAITSAIFLAAISATVVYLSVTHADVIDEPDAPAAANPGREKAMLGFFGAVVVATGALLAWANARPHATPPSAEGSAVIVPVAAGQAAAHFPVADVTNLRTIGQGILARVQAGDQVGARAGAKRLETAWDDAQSKLEAMDEATWTAIDGRIDVVLTSIRDAHPDPATETQGLDGLLSALG